jgi:DUF4097 and DUF4098 domain-containing protein YvlB
MRNGTFLLLALALPVLGQFRDNTEPKLNCDQRHRGRDKQERFCEVRESRLPVTQRLDVDAAPNGGVTVLGWSRNEILVRARVESVSQSEAEAKNLAQQVQVQTAAGKIKATGPKAANSSWWSVSYEVFVPHKVDLSVETVNGGVNAQDLEGRLEFRTLNGGMNLTRLAGDVKGRTTNGGLNVDLVGGAWRGGGLDVETTNGGVNVALPADYSARVQMQTRNGGLRTDFPAAVVGDRHERQTSLDFSIGSGGAPVRVVTTNGGVTLKKKSI